MPALTFVILILSVIVAGGVTVWLVSNGGAAVMVAALPAFMIAAVALKVLRK
ncbi:hypothetical protein [uncultured Sulfitobacter sp.]|uniref:hypothetical protein n=1 Tax=uncultured Sulfitobacter sp. TaxID=191468 RepID=UPI0026033806|nr:hypothetical protein [uncultured Sulfitobacter sp.]